MSENMCGIQNTVNGDNIVELILDPDSDGDVSDWTTWQWDVW